MLNLRLNDIQFDDAVYYTAIVIAQHVQIIIQPNAHCINKRKSDNTNKHKTYSSSRISDRYGVYLKFICNCFWNVDMCWELFHVIMDLNKTFDQVNIRIWLDVLFSQSLRSIYWLSHLIVRKVSDILIFTKQGLLIQFDVTVYCNKDYPF